MSVGCSGRSGVFNELVTSGKLAPENINKTGTEGLNEEISVLTSFWQEGNGAEKGRADYKAQGIEG